jgi:hypothetical protein
MNNDEVSGELLGPDDGVEYIDGSTALMALNKSEIDTQITTAKRYPRSIKQFKQNAMELACLDEETAGSMFYVLPRGGKKIEGPSTRLAEVVGSSWGNLRYGSRVVSTDDKFVTAQGACFDLEKNIAITVEVKRRITDKNNKRYNDDMITVTSNAACSIALRNAIFKIVPFAVVKTIYEQARLTSVGKADSLEAKRGKMLDWFTKAGATQEQVLAAIGRPGVDDVTLDDLITLRGLANAIKEGEATIEAVLGPAPDKAKKVNRSDVNKQIDEAAAKAKTNGSASGNGNGHKLDTTESQESPGDNSDLRDAAAADEALDAIAEEFNEASQGNTFQVVSDIQARAFQARKWSEGQSKRIDEMAEAARQAIRGKRGGNANKGKQTELEGAK